MKYRYGLQILQKCFIMFEMSTFMYNQVHFGRDLKADLSVQDKDLRAAAKLLQDALNAPTVEQEEALWYVERPPIYLSLSEQSDRLIYMEPACNL